MYSKRIALAVALFSTFSMLSIFPSLSLHAQNGTPKLKDDNINKLNEVVVK
jgi:hypothetical protein